MSRESNTARVAVITVTYHPAPECLERQAATLPEDALLVLVDNGSNANEVDVLQKLVAQRAHTHLIRNNMNLGLAAALNQGVHYVTATDATCDFVLLMDQDSEPHPGAIQQLLRSFVLLEEEGMAVGCVGPRLVDETTGLQHGFHCISGWRWVRRFPRPDDSHSISCVNLNGSGTLMRMGLFQHLGGLDESLFIDHVDTDWSFRVLASGFGLFGVPQATFNHAMGERGIRIWWFGWRVWPQRSPARHYYLFRNATCLLRRAYVPNVWKTWAVTKLMLTLSIHVLFDSRRGAQITSMFRGFMDGLRMKQRLVADTKNRRLL